MSITAEDFHWTAADGLRLAGCVWHPPVEVPGAVPLTSTLALTNATLRYTIALADQGVDVIIGTHPHVVQNAAWLTGVNGNTTFIVYSLGNFINAQSSRDNVIGAILDVYFDKTTQPDGSVSIAIRDPKLHCVISQYEAGYKNIRVIPYSQYTDELGAAHGEFTLSREYIESMLRSTIDEEFLTLD